jgi:hypothetical protein
MKAKNVIWTDSDIDAAYLMGVINATCHKIDPAEIFPSLEIVRMEIERLKKIGFNNPSDAVKVLRNKKETDDTKKLLDDIISWEKDLSQYNDLESILREKYIILKRRKDNENEIRTN